MRCRARPQRVTCTRLTDAGTALRHVSFHLHIGLVLTLPAKAAKKICMLLSAPAFFRRGAAENDFSGANRHIVSQRAAHVKIWMVALGFGSASRANGNARRRAENSTGRKAHEGEHRAQHKTWVRTELSVIHLRPNQPARVRQFKTVLKQLKGRKVPVFIHSGGGEVREAMAIGNVTALKG